MRAEHTFQTRREIRVEQHDVGSDRRRDPEAARFAPRRAGDGSNALQMFDKAVGDNLVLARYQHYRSAGAMGRKLHREVEHTPHFAYDPELVEGFRKAAFRTTNWFILGWSEHDDRDFACGVNRSELSQEVRAWQLRQGEVQENNVTAVLLNESQPACAIRGAHNEIALARQHFRGEPALPRVVVHYQRGPL
jgi:hypothetical protein